MKKFFCLVLVLCLLGPLAFGQPLAIDIEKRNYIVQKEYNLGLLIPSLVFCVGAGCLFAEANRLEDPGAGVSVVAVILTFTGLAFLIEAITPEETFWFPKIDENGTIWFEKGVRW